MGYSLYTELIPQLNGTYRIAQYANNAGYAGIPLWVNSTWAPINPNSVTAKLRESDSPRRVNFVR